MFLKTFSILSARCSISFSHVGSCLIDQTFQQQKSSHHPKPMMVVSHSTLSSRCSNSLKLVGSCPIGQPFKQQQITVISSIHPLPKFSLGEILVQAAMKTTSSVKSIEREAVLACTPVVAYAKSIFKRALYNQNPINQQQQQHDPLGYFQESLWIYSSPKHNPYLDDETLKFFGCARHWFVVAEDNTQYLDQYAEWRTNFDEGQGVACVTTISQNTVKGSQKLWKRLVVSFVKEFCFPRRVSREPELQLKKLYLVEKLNNSKPIKLRRLRLVDKLRH
ncbi:unnamed protein product [Ambrosiozyma monospora]|uniref:Unnamed protein product n=1 Tax=Ambrosiozyma monospora TaxID=43982 RepID=A0A9W6YYL7_AMBMO|nr:unnamed protein product [Ambrosiozyma monospora]